MEPLIVHSILPAFYYVVFGFSQRTRLSLNIQGPPPQEPGTGELHDQRPALEHRIVDLEALRQLPGVCKPFDINRFQRKFQWDWHHELLWIVPDEESRQYLFVFLNELNFCDVLSLSSLANGTSAFANLVDDLFLDLVHLNLVAQGWELPAPGTQEYGYTQPRTHAHDVFAEQAEPLFVFKNLLSATGNYKASYFRLYDHEDVEKKTKRHLCWDAGCLEDSRNVQRSSKTSCYAALWPFLQDRDRHIICFICGYNQEEVDERWSRPPASDDDDFPPGTPFPPPIHRPQPRPSCTIKIRKSIAEKR